MMPDVKAAMKSVGYVRLAGLCALLALLYVVNARAVALWQSRFFFGEVRSVAANRLVITDPLSLEIPLFFGPHVRRRFGAGEAPSLQLNDQVMVAIRTNERGTNEVVIVRLVTKEDIRQNDLPHA